MVRRIRRGRLPRISRDGALFIGGLLGLAHETLLADAERPTLIFAFMAMVGLPAFLRADEKRKDGGKPPEDDPPPKERP